MNTALPFSAFNVEEIRRDFPILERRIHDGMHLAYLDSAATSQKPVQVIETMNMYYRNITRIYIAVCIHWLKKPQACMKAQGKRSLILSMRHHQMR